MFPVVSGFLGGKLLKAREFGQGGGMASVMDGRRSSTFC